MTLSELVNRISRSPQQSVPDWMLGCFRRRCISFSNGESDDKTIVYWFQSRNFTIDLRLPVESDQVRSARLEDYTAEELSVLANYEGWSADSEWRNSQMSWHGGTALQVTNRWPEPAALHRIGNCMIEFAPSGAYVEDWRLQPTAPGAMVGLKLVEEYDPVTKERFPRDGGLIICGDHAALVLGRSEPPSDSGLALPDMAALAVGNPSLLEPLFDFESSVAHGSLMTGYKVIHSTRPERLGQPLLSSDGFECNSATGQVEQTVDTDEGRRVRVFDVDVIETGHNFELDTPSNTEAQAWFQRESATLCRYTRVLT